VTAAGGSVRARVPCVLALVESSLARAPAARARPAPTKSQPRGGAEGKGRWAAFRASAAERATMTTPPRRARATRPRHSTWRHPRWCRRQPRTPRLPRPLQQPRRRPSPVAV